MKIIKSQETEMLKNQHGVKVNKFYDTKQAQVMHITLEPGESLKKHATPINVFFFILEGKGIIEIGEEKETVEANTLIDSPAHIPHCLYNQGNKVFRFLVVKLFQ